MKRSTLFFLVTIFVTVSFVLGYFFKSFIKSEAATSPDVTPAPTPLAVYEIEKLSQETFEGAKIEIEKKLKDEKEFSSYLFSMNFLPNPNLKETKTTTGIINVPNEVPAPVIVMFRGYIDQANYVSGAGTKNASEYFSQNGFITIAPDFLGYGQSDENSADIFESRFQTYTTAIHLIKAVKNIKEWDGKNIFIWGHSNGGQIAITTLEIMEENIPTVLWAPVTKPFPYSILYYTDQSEDKGKYIRSELSEFEKIYDVEKFSLSDYIDRIKAPIQIQQGGTDDAVPKDWSDTFSNLLEKNRIDIVYHIYPASDHNLRMNWDQAVEKDISFFNRFID